MHSYIIQISDAPVSEENRIDEFDLQDDRLLGSRADYYGGDRNDERETAIVRVRELLADFADVSDEGVIRVLSEPDEKEHAKSVFRQWLRDTCTRADGASVSMLRCRLEDFRENSLIIALCFCQDGGSIIGPTCRNSADFVEDMLNGHLPETLYVGAVLDYHA